MEKECPIPEPFKAMAGNIVFITALFFLTFIARFIFAPLMPAIERELGIEEGETTKDQQFTLEAVRCIGCCALAPAMRIDGETFALVRQNRIPAILEKSR